MEGENVKKENVYAIQNGLQKIVVQRRVRMAALEMAYVI